MAGTSTASRATRGVASFVFYTLAVLGAVITAISVQGGFATLQSFAWQVPIVAGLGFLGWLFTKRGR